MCLSCGIHWRKIGIETSVSGGNSQSQSAIRGHSNVIAYVDMMPTRDSESSPSCVSYSILVCVVRKQISAKSSVKKPHANVFERQE